jgi:hypothetical protein
MAKKDEVMVQGSENEFAVTEAQRNEVVDFFGGQVPGMEGISFRFGSVKVAHQSGAFEMPDGNMTKSFKGVILHIQSCNAYWETSFNESGGGTPPTCASNDGIRPSPASSKLQADTCRQCGRNIFGADGKRGKLCKNMKRMYILMDGYDLPVRLTAPPTSLRSIDEYGSLLAYKALRYIMVQTQFGLKEERNKDGIKFSALTFVPLGTSAHNKEEADRLMKLRNDFMPQMIGEEITAEEYSSVD